MKKASRILTTAETRQREHDATQPKSAPKKGTVIHSDPNAQVCEPGTCT